MRKKKDVTLLNLLVEKPQSTLDAAWNLLVRAVLCCLGTVGLCVSFAQLYKIPTDVFSLAGYAAAWTAGFILLFFLLKLRYALPLLALCGAGYIWLTGSFETLQTQLSYLWDYLLNRLDSRLLSTARFAGAVYDADSVYSLFESGGVSGRMLLIQGGFMIAVIVTALLLALYAYSKRPGFVLIFSVVSVIPSIGAEIAGFVPGHILLVAALFGLYAMYSVNIRCSLPMRTPWYKPLGGMPSFRRYGGSAVFMAICTVLAAFAAQAILPESRTQDITAMFRDISTGIQRGVTDMVDQLAGQAGEPNTKGYFPEDGNPRTPDYLSLEAPSSGLEPVAYAYLTGIDSPVYLRGAIGRYYDSQQNRVPMANDDAIAEEMYDLLSRYGPEAEVGAFILADGTERYYQSGEVSVEFLRPMSQMLIPSIMSVSPDTTGFSQAADRVWTKSPDNVGPFLFYADVISPLPAAFYDFFLYADDITGELLDITDVLTYRDLIRRAYLTTSPEEAENIRRLSEAIGIYDNPIAAGNAAVDYFQNHFTYSLTADNSMAGNTVLGNFLFETQSGHCALYAAAMTEYMRASGFPARYVTGYVTRTNGDPQTDGSVRYTLRERDLHAWVEVYVPNIGWLTYDPTPAITDAVYDSGTNATTTTAATTTTTAETTVTTQAAETTVPETTTTPDPDDPADQTTINPDENDGESSLALWLIIAAAIIIIALAAGAGLYIRAVSRYGRALPQKIKGVSDRAGAKRLLTLIFRLLAWDGMTVETGETPEMFGLRIGASDFMAAAEKLEFSTEELTKEEYGIMSRFALRHLNEQVRNQKPARRFSRTAELRKLFAKK
jgi:transglutaminase-like putative cysteine protease